MVVAGEGGGAVSQVRGELARQGTVDGTVHLAAQVRETRGRPAAAAAAAVTVTAATVAEQRGRRVVAVAGLEEGGGSVAREAAGGDRHK